MKKLLIPVIIAVLAGVGGGSGFSYMRASKAYLADSLQRVDSLKAHPPAAHDSSATADSSHAAGDAHGADSVSLEEHLPMTPADSIRALSAARESLRSATSGVPDAKDHDATDHKAAPAKGATDASHAPDATHKNDGKSDSKSGTAAVAEIVRAARNEAMTTTLPEQRLAKIFAAMSAKDAAKVMEQMPDGDVRSILSLMNDRSAAALLAQFTPARAAAITKGAIRANGEKP